MKLCWIIMGFKMEKGVGERYRATWPNGLRPGLGLARRSSKNPNKTRILAGNLSRCKGCPEKSTDTSSWLQADGIEVQLWGEHMLHSLLQWEQADTPSLRKELWGLSSPRRFFVKLKGDCSSPYLCLVRFVTLVSQWILKFYKCNRDAKNLILIWEV